MGTNAVFTPGGDMYHFACLRKEIGDLSLIGILAQRLMDASHPSAMMAVKAAVDQFELLDQMQNGGSIFSEMRIERGLGRMGKAQKSMMIEAPGAPAEKDK